MCAILLIYVESASIEWKWLSGSSGNDQTSICGTQGQYSTAYTPGSRYSSALSDAVHASTIYLFGGEGWHTGGSGWMLGDIWGYRQTKWSTNGEWGWMGSPNNVGDYVGMYGGATPYPGARKGSSIWSTASGKVYIYGGATNIGATNLFSDLWRFDVGTKSWTWLKGPSTANANAVFGTNNVPTSSNNGGGAYMHQVLRTTTNENGTTLIYGGHGYDTSAVGRLSDVWSLNSSVLHWTWINGPGSINKNSIGGSSGVYSSTYYPGGRSSAAAMDTTYRAGSDFVYLFGGNGYSSTAGPDYLADLWAYNTVTNEWAYIAGESSAVGGSAVGSYGSLGLFSASNHPGSRGNVAAYADPNSALIHVYSGYGYDQATTSGHLNDFWSFNVSAKQWSWASGDSVINQNGNYADSVWFSATNNPKARRESRGSCSQDLGLMFMFGGRDSSNSFNDFWVTKGPAIVVGMSPTTSPTASPTTSPTISPSPTASPTISPIPTATPLYPLSWWKLSGSYWNQMSVCGVQGQYSATFYPGSRRHTAMTAASNNVFHMWGGTGFHGTAVGRLGDMWAHRQLAWSSQGEWAWVGGYSGVGDHHGQYEGVTPYPGGRFGSVAWNGPGTKLFIHGGTGHDSTMNLGELNEVWTFDTGNKGWKWVKGSSLRNQVANFGTKNVTAVENMPGGMYYHLRLSVGPELLIIFGGKGHDGASYGSLSDVWTYNTTSNCWTWINGPGSVNENSIGGVSGVYSSAYYPGGRFGAAVAGETSKSVVYIYGGYGYSNNQSGDSLADLWAFTIPTREWAYIAGESSRIGNAAPRSYGSLGYFSASNYPGSRHYFSGWKDPNSDLICVFGGFGYNTNTTIGQLDDFWAFNTSTKQWVWVGGASVDEVHEVYNDVQWYSTLNKPGCRYGHSTTINNGLMLLFGGYGESNYNNLWSTRGPTIVIGASPTPTITPSPTATPGLYPISWRWLFGSSGGNQNGACGSAGLFSNAYYPGGRYAAGCTASTNDNVNNVYLYGGIGYPTAGGSVYLGDLWAYRQGSWNTPGEWAWLGGKSATGSHTGQYEGISPYPGARYNPAIWPVSTDGIIMFGGWGFDNNTSGYLNDLWQFNTGTLSFEWLKGSSSINSIAVYNQLNVPSMSNIPGGAHARMQLMSRQDGTKTLLFGGAGYDTASTGRLCETWVYNVSTNTFTWIHGQSTRNHNGVGGESGMFHSTYHPGSRFSSAVMAAADGSSCYIFGGYGFSVSQGDGDLADLWKYNVATNEWAYVIGESTGMNIEALASFGSVGHFSVSNRPGAHSHISGWIDPNSVDILTIFGGDGYGETVVRDNTNDMWSFNISSKLWCWVAGDSIVNQPGIYADDSWFSTSNKLGRRHRQASFVNWNLGLMYVFGGREDSGKRYDDLWATKGSTVLVGASPSPTVTASPTLSPTASPSSSPTVSPTLSPTPSVSPTTSPTATPTVSPTVSPTTSPTATPTAVPLPTTGGVGSGSGSGGIGLDDMTLYIIIGAGALFGLCVVVFAGIASTKRGREGLKVICGGRKKRRNVVNVVVSSKHDGEQMNQQQVIHQTVIQQNIFVSDPMQQQIQPGTVVIAQYAQEPQDSSQLQVCQGDCLRIEQVAENGWLYGSLLDESGEAISSGWYPSAWVQPVKQGHFGFDDDPPPLK